MNAAICCPERFAAPQRPFAGYADRIAGWFRTGRGQRATWKGLRLLDDRSLGETGVTPGRYWPLDRRYRD